MKKKQWLIVSVLMDMILANAAVVAAFYIRFGFNVPAFNFTAYLTLAPFLTVILLLSFYFYDLYTTERVLGGWGTFFSVVKASTLTIVLIIAGGFIFQAFSFPRSVFLISWLDLIVLLSIFRIYIFKFVKIHWPKQNVLVVGINDTTDEVVRMLADHLKWGVDLAGLVSENTGDIGQTIEGVKVVGHTGEILDLVRIMKADRVICVKAELGRKILQELADHPEIKLKVEIIPDLYEIFIGKLEYNSLEDIPLIEINKADKNTYLVFGKQLLDIFLSIAAAITLAPLFIIVAIITKLTSKGPVFYLQERVGQDQRTFNIIKFRTMVTDAEKESGPVFAADNDPRITKIGKVLRKYHLDELPQIFNVLTLKMSFVGPRPERPVFVNEYKKSVPGYLERYGVKPGITGLAQISGFYASDASRKLKFDLMYIYNPSFLLDLKILFKTTKILFSGKEF